MPHSPDRLTLEPEQARPCVALIGDGVDWHARELVRALVAVGARAVPIRLERCEFSTTSACGLRIDRFDRLPDAVIVRSMSGGTFEAVTRRLGILHALRELGVPVWNDARAIERCVDKSMTTFLLARAGIATPPTWTVESPAAARAIVARETGPLVLKPLFGSQGRGLRLIRNPDDLPAPDRIAGVYYLQKFVGVERDGFRDFRLLVSDGRVVAAMARHAASWITNVKQGGRPVAAVADAEMKELSIGAAAAVGASFAGVDLVCGADGHCVLEVNSMPAWSGLQKVTPADIAAALVADLMAALAGKARRGAAV
jgi:tetrahydromethanopterin:alpha-L-glutamate ligase